MVWFSIFGSILLVPWISGLPTSEEGSIVCNNKKGRVGNPKDCGSYYECMEDEYARSLLSVERFCPKEYSFNSSSARCENTLIVLGRNTCSSGRHSKTNPNYDYICKISNVSYACIDCQTQITCIDGHAYVAKCVNRMRCVTNTPDFEGAVCHTHFDDQCRCIKPNSYRRDPFTDTKFFSCEAENAVPNYFNCQQGMFFDEVSQTCVSNDGTPECAASGLFTFPENCAKYYNCTSVVKGWDQKIISCPDKQLFNQETGMCEDPCNWELKEFKCEKQGRFQDPRDCQRYTECVNDYNGTFFATEKRCPSGYYFSEKNKKCVVRILSGCKQPKEGPIEQCKKDFLAICKSKGEIIPVIIPETVLIEENDGKEPGSDIITEKTPIAITPEAEKVPEQKLVTGEPIKETPMEEKYATEKQTEGNPVEEEPIEVILGKPENYPELTDVLQIEELPQEILPLPFS